MLKVFNYINMVSDNFGYFIMVVVILGYFIILKVSKKEREERKEQELKLKIEYLEKIKKLYKLENNSKVDLIIEELEQKDIEFIRDYYFRELEQQIKEGK